MRESKRAPESNKQCWEVEQIEQGEKERGTVCVCGGKVSLSPSNSLRVDVYAEVINWGVEMEKEEKSGNMKGER